MRSSFTAIVLLVLAIEGFQSVASTTVFEFNPLAEQRHLACPTQVCASCFGDNFNSSVKDMIADFLISACRQDDHVPLPKMAFTASNSPTCGDKPNEELETLKLKHGMPIKAAAFTQIALSSPVAFTTKIGEETVQRLTDFYQQKYVQQKSSLIDLRPSEAGSMPFRNASSNQQPLRAFGPDWHYYGGKQQAKVIDSYAQGYLFNLLANQTEYEMPASLEPVRFPVGPPTLEASVMAAIALSQSLNAQIETAPGAPSHAPSKQPTSAPPQPPFPDPSTHTFNDLSYEEKVLILRITQHPATIFFQNLLSTLEITKSGSWFLESPRLNEKRDEHGIVLGGEEEEKVRRVLQPHRRERSEIEMEEEAHFALNRRLAAKLEMKGIFKKEDSPAPARFIPGGPTVPEHPNHTTTTTHAPTSTPHPSTHKPHPPPLVRSGTKTISQSETGRPDDIVTTKSQVTLLAANTMFQNLTRKVRGAGWNTQLLEALDISSKVLLDGMQILIAFSAFQPLYLSNIPGSGFGGAKINEMNFSTMFLPAAFIVDGIENSVLSAVAKPRSDSDCGIPSKGSAPGMDGIRNDPCSPFFFDIETQLFTLLSWGWKIETVDGSILSLRVMDLMQVLMSVARVQGAGPKSGSLGDRIGATYSSPYIMSLAQLTVQHLLEELPNLGHLNASVKVEYKGVLEEMEQALNRSVTYERRQCHLYEDRDHISIYGTIGDDRCRDRPYPLTLDSAASVLAARRENPFKLFQNFPLPVTPSPPTTSTTTTTTAPTTSSPTTITTETTTTTTTTTTVVPTTTSSRAETTSSVMPTTLPMTTTETTTTHLLTTTSVQTTSTLATTTSGPTTTVTELSTTTSTSTPSTSTGTTEPTTTTTTTQSLAPMTTKDHGGNSGKRTNSPGPTFGPHGFGPNPSGPKAPGPRDHTGLITAVIAGAVVVFCLGAAIGLAMYRRQKKKREEELLEQPTENLGFY